MTHPYFSKNGTRNSVSPTELHSLTRANACAAGMMSNLKLLDLSHNRIGDKGACALAAMLIGEGMTSSLPLQSLELEGNQVL